MLSFIEILKAILVGIVEGITAVSYTHRWQNLDTIGYIRSSRDYFVYSALEFDAIYAHFGQATPYVGDLLNSDLVDNISGAVAGIDLSLIHICGRNRQSVCVFWSRFSDSGTGGDGASDACTDNFLFRCV